VPARFSALLGTILILQGAWGAKRILTGRTRRAQYALAAAMVAAIGVDLRLTLELRGYDTDIPAFYAQLGPASIVASLPSGHEIDYMYFSTSGWNQMLKGYSGFIPLDDELEGALTSVPEPSSIDFLRSRGATHLTYVCAFERSEPRCEYNLTALAGSPRLELVAEEEWHGTPARLYRLK
jgi:hypothetical protein